MPDGTENSSGHPSDQGRSSDGSQNPSQPQAYDKNQVDKLLNERHSKLDRQIADLTKERDRLVLISRKDKSNSNKVLDSLVLYR